MDWTKILAVVGAAIVLYFLHRHLKGNPEQFSKANLSKSFTTVGLLGIGLIGFIAFMVLLLKTSS